jgi:hypothetical protein
LHQDALLLLRHDIFDFITMSFFCHFTILSYVHKLLSISNGNAKNERQKNRRRSLSEDGALKLALHEIHAPVFLSAPFFC